MPAVPNIPKTLVVGGKRIHIRVIPDLEAYGEYHHEIAEIRVSAKTAQNPSVLAETLRHEIAHAAFAISGIGFLPNFPEESVVRCLDEMFFPAYERLLSQLNKTGEPKHPTKT